MPDGDPSAGDFDVAKSARHQKDRLDATHDYEVNIKVELEIPSLHEKLDELRELK